MSAASSQESGVMNNISIAPIVALVVAMISSIVLAQTVETEVSRLQPSQSIVGDQPWHIGRS